MKISLFTVLLGASLFFSAAQGQGFIELLGPLEAVAGEDLMIICASVAPSEVVLRENGLVVEDDRIDTLVINATHRVYVLTETTLEDDGRVFTCGIAEFNSNSETVNIFPPPNEVTTTEPTGPSCPDVSGSLYFELNGRMYQSGSSILITEVGVFSGSTGPFNPDSSLVCVTSEVNSQCCRMRDGGNVGEWHFPDGSIVQRNRGGDFFRSAYTEQVRLSRRNDAVSPVGEYTCVVPREDGCGGLMHTGTISLVLPVPRSVMGLCVITVWSPPEGSRFDFFTGYDVRFYIDGSEGDIIVNKGNEFFHLTTDDIRELGPEEEILVQVRVLSDGGGAGPWTDPVALCP